MATKATRALFSVFTLILGLQRLTFSTGNGALLPWICVVATHCFETVFWWYVAADLGVLNKFDSVSVMVVQLCKNRTPANVHVFILLFFVPFIALICIVGGPSSSSKTASESKKSK